MTTGAPLHDGYLADPLVRTDQGYVAYGTDPGRDGTAASSWSSPRRTC